MDNEQFSLCWNNFQNNLSTGFQDLFKDEDLVDVTLAAEGRYIKAHKTVLSVCSPYFKELFRVNPCKHPIVILQDVNYNALEALLQFMYNGEVSVSQEEIPTFMRVAEILKVKGLTDNAGLANNASQPDNKLSTNGISNNVHNDEHLPQPYVGVADKQPIMKRTRPVKKPLIKPIQHLKPLEFPNSSSSPSYTSSSSPQPPVKQPRLEETRPPAVYNEPLIQPKLEPVDHPEEDEYLQPQQMPVLHNPYDRDDKEIMSLPPPATSDNNVKYSMNMKVTADASSPGTLQCILGKRGLPRLIVDGYTFFKKSTYKNKCFWYCKTNRTYKCPAVCWTVNGRIVKWPEAHTHAIVPEVITPGEDTVVPIEMLRQVLIDAAR